MKEKILFTSFRKIVYSGKELGQYICIIILSGELNPICIKKTIGIEVIYRYKRKEKSNS